MGKQQGRVGSLCPPNCGARTYPLLRSDAGHGVPTLKKICVNRPAPPAIHKALAEPNRQVLFQPKSPALIANQAP